MKALVVSFDHLPLAFLGCYGNTWVDTPHFDRLAAESVVFERCFTENADPDAAGHAWWTGCRQFPAEPGGVRGRSVPSALADAGVRTVLLTEQPAARPSPRPEGFGESAEVAGDEGLEVPVDETPFAKLVAEATRRLRDDLSGDDSWLLWLKSRGVPMPWLPPREFAMAYVPLFEDMDEEWDEEEGEPLPEGEADFTPEAATAAEPAAVPVGDAEADDDVDFEWDADEEEDFFDPDLPEYDDRSWDELDEEERAEYDQLLTALAEVGLREDTLDLQLGDWLMSRAVYAGYVSLLDRYLGELRTAIAETCGEEVLLIVTAARGESLGERAELPRDWAAVGEERLHVPLFVRAPDGQSGTRRHELVQDVDVPCTLLDWFRADSSKIPVEGASLLPVSRGEGEWSRSAIASGDGLRTVALRTAEFVLVEKQQDEGPADRFLFVEPDDVWQVHDVSSQEPDVVERYSAALRAYLDSATEQVPARVPEVQPESGE